MSSQENKKEFDVDASIEIMKHQLSTKFNASVREQFDKLNGIDQVTFYLGFVAGSACGWVEGVSDLSNNLKNVPRETL